MSLQQTFDLVVIGGGVNGCGIARDAAGRGLRSLLCERGDLAGATSSASTKLIHGGLRYLEHYAFRLVRHALEERETLLAHRAAHHLAAALRAALSPGLRPAWMLRLGLLLYDHIGGRKLLPPTRTLRLDRDAAGAPLRRRARASASNIRTAGCRTRGSSCSTRATPAARGAEIRVRTACRGARAPRARSGTSISRTSIPAAG